MAYKPHIKSVRYLTNSPTKRETGGTDIVLPLWTKYKNNVIKRLSGVNLNTISRYKYIMECWQSARADLQMDGFGTTPIVGFTSYKILCLCTFSLINLWPSEKLDVTFSYIQFLSTITCSTGCTEVALVLCSWSQLNLNTEGFHHTCGNKNVNISFIWNY